MAETNTLIMKTCTCENPTVWNCEGGSICSACTLDLCTCNEGWTRGVIHRGNGEPCYIPTGTIRNFTCSEHGRINPTPMCPACKDEAPARQQPSREEWEREFDKQFDPETHWQGDEWVTEKVKSFIRSLLSRERARVSEEVEKSFESSTWAKTHYDMACADERVKVIEICKGMRKQEPSGNYIGDPIWEQFFGYNAALSDLQAVLRNDKGV
jgi:hypothetical protein